LKRAFFLDAAVTPNDEKAIAAHQAPLAGNDAFAVEIQHHCRDLI
jgi:hypothetical protein